MIQSPKRKVVQICNIIISILCVLSISFYFFQPLFQMEISYTINADMMNSMVNSMVNSSVDEGSSDEEDSSTSVMEFDFNPITVGMKLTFRTQDVLASLGNDPTQGVQNMIDENISNLVDDLTASFDSILPAMLKMMSKATITSSVKEQVKDAFAGEKTSEEVDQILEDVGFTDEYIDQQTDVIFDALYAEDATVDSVTDAIIDVVDDVYNKLASAEHEEFVGGLDEETKESLREEISDVLGAMADENGNFNFNSVFTDLLLGMMNGETPGDGNPDDSSSEDSSSSEEGVAGMSFKISGILATPVNSESGDSSSVAGDSSSSEPMTEEELMAELKAKLTEEIMKMIPEDLATSIAEVMKVISYVLLFTFFTWAYLIIKIAAKWGRTNNAIKLGVPIWLGCIPFWILYAMPTSMAALMTNPPAAMMETAGVVLKSVLSSLSLKFTSGAWFSGYAAIALALFAIFYYGGLRRYLRKVEKGKIIIEEPVAPVAETASETVAATQENVAEETAASAEFEESVQSAEEEKAAEPVEEAADAAEEKTESES